MTATRHANLGLDAPTLEPDDHLVDQLAALAAASQAAPSPLGVPPWRVALATAGLVGVSVGGAWATGTISVPGLPERDSAPHDKPTPSAPPTPEEPGTPRSGSSGSTTDDSFTPAPAPTPQTPGPADDASVSPDDKALGTAGPGQGNGQGQGQGQGQPPTEHPGQGQRPTEHPGQGHGQGQGQGSGQGSGQDKGTGPSEGRSD